MWIITVERGEQVLGIFLFFTIVWVICWALGAVFIGRWTHRDAIRRGLPRPMLWAVCAALIPYCIGFILYILIKPRPIVFQCSFCRTTVHRKQYTCPGCGAQKTEARPELPPPAPQAKTWMTVYIACCAGCVVFYVLATIQFWTLLFS